MLFGLMELAVGLHYLITQHIAWVLVALPYGGLPYGGLPYGGLPASVHRSCRVLRTDTGDRTRTGRRTHRQDATGGRINY